MSLSKIIDARILFKLKEKTKFFFRAKNAHGLHSPFAFNLYTTVKTQSKRKNQPIEKTLNFNLRESRIILAFIQYFKPKRVLLLSEEEQIIAEWQPFFSGDTVLVAKKNTDNVMNEASKFDLIIVDKLLFIREKELLNNLSHLFSNESVVIIPHIHASKDIINRWKDLIKENNVRVSMDFFFIGVLFFREESIKQDFQMRF